MRKIVGEKSLPIFNCMIHSKEYSSHTMCPTLPVNESMLFEDCTQLFQFSNCKKDLSLFTEQLHLFIVTF